MTPKGHGEKLSRLQGRAIVAILAAPTLTAAAKQIKVAPRTLKNWLRRPEFRAELKTAGQCVFQDSLTRLSGATMRAVTALNRAMRSGNPAVQVRAAVAILELSMKAREQSDLADRIDAIEKSHGLPDQRF
jgi:hypothetical protein